MTVNFKLEGLDQLQSKLDLLANPKKAKSIARKAARQAMNIARDVARSAARNLDDPITSEKIYKEILIIINIMYNINNNIIINRRIPSTIIIKISNKTIYLNNKI